MRRLILLIGIIAIVSLAGYFIRRITAISCPTTSVGSNHDVNPELIKGSTDFAIKLYAQLAAESEGNFIYSPYSISQAFAMLYPGADGETKAQIEDVLGFTLPPEETHANFQILNHALAANAEQSDSVWCNANAVWIAKTYPVNPVYVDIVKKYYEAGIQAADFQSQPEAARQVINRWVEQQTRDRIRELFAPNAITSDTALVLANAVYFKSNWETAFSKNFTKQEPFKLLDGTVITVPMMNLDKQALFGYELGTDYQVVELPYKHGTSMIIVLPAEGAFMRIESAIGSAFFNSLQLSSYPIYVSMPRFEFESTFDLPDPLIELGLTDAFDPARADFRNIKLSDAQLNLYIDMATHKAYIKTDETGTEAAAASGLVAIPITASFPTHVRIDRPFIFAIRDQKTGAIIFLGRVLNPLVGSS